MIRKRASSYVLILPRSGSFRNLSYAGLSRTVALDTPAITASRDSDVSIDRLFNEKHDAGQKRSVEKDDDVLEEAIAKDASKTIAEKP
ncbi:hypothetical protein Tco_0975689 [Tanacetum coccineum]|uniref:Uncharacterized protein n=1 Tax=Tanacetum coccineum TaxID=301880 RepID=A0ABQ5EFF1_9ASTR